MERTSRGASLTHKYILPDRRTVKRYATHCGCAHTLQSARTFSNTCFSSAGCTLLITMSRMALVRPGHMAASRRLIMDTWPGAGRGAAEEDK